MPHGILEAVRAEIKKILKNKPDPLNVRKSTSGVFENMKFIEVDLDKIEETANRVNKLIKQEQILDEGQFGQKNPSQQLIFVLDAINFCFWSTPDQEKWQIEFPKGTIVKGGWYGLVAVFKRAREHDIDLLDANYLERLSFKKAKEIFEGHNDIEIPLLKNRVEILNEVGKKLNKSFNGNIENFLTTTNYDLAEIAKKIIVEFPSFEDYRVLKNKRINFYKRAQIFAYDISLLSGVNSSNKVALTAFADYKIPQILCEMGVIKYKSELSKKIDNYVILKEGSLEEIEIRSATIWVCELIANNANVDTVLVDNALWNLSQKLDFTKPYHRVLTTCY
jgi:hypothetical protein